MREVPITVSTGADDLIASSWDGQVMLFGQAVSSFKVQSAGLLGKIPGKAPQEAPFVVDQPSTLSKLNKLKWVSHYGMSHFQYCTSPFCLEIKHDIANGTITEQDMLDYEKAHVVNSGFLDDAIPY